MSNGDTCPDERPPEDRPYDAPYLARNPANHAALTPLGFLERAAAIYPDKIAVIEPAPAQATGITNGGATNESERRFTYRQFYERCRRFADALRRCGIGPGDTVSVLALNVPALLEAHYAVPMAGAVLNALNYRLDARSIAFILDHGGAKLLIADREFSAVMGAALALAETRPVIIDIADPMHEGGTAIGEMDYEAFLATGDPAASWSLPADEWQAIALGYTSGTTGNPKGVVTHHRGAFLNAMGNAIAFGVS